ncbi:hypothetical protein [Enhygromyxa salina]|uniref:hypothetical protein n=1 Tax=Enhygromyxa salina TaxID=215803 RepID=UPI0011B2953F|nr:hypothetical protein [Enhygromyxa salina]
MNKHLRLPHYRDHEPVAVRRVPGGREYTLLVVGLAVTHVVSGEDEASAPDLKNFMNSVYSELAKQWVQRYWMRVLENGGIFRADRGSGTTIWLEVAGVSMLLTWDDGTVIADRLEERGHAWDAALIRERIEAARLWDAKQEADRTYWAADGSADEPDIPS